ncbi:hypothetical protein MMC27_004727 [Xylographa pallens]|nr:hypothetical protein [Xylographa pallens]
MSISRRHFWPARTRQKALLEFARLKLNCPPGIYVSLTPGNPNTWSGVFFTRNGPYVPAILRFEVTFPDEYPRFPPLIVFNSDIFHPLVTPLSTYTYTPGSAGSGATSPSDQERLPPGGFSLKHAFPDWVGQTTPGIVTSASEALVNTSLKRHGELECDSDEHQTARPTQKTGAVYRTNADACEPQSPSQLREVPTMVDILYYIKSSFEDEKLLDDLPLGYAVCPGAWHAWATYRRRVEQDLSSVKPDDSPGGQLRTHQGIASVLTSAKPASHWNWDGVWVQRVKTGVETSISEPVLYASDGVDPIQFRNVDDNVIKSIREQFNSTSHG